MSLRQHAAERVDVPVNREERPEVADEAQKRREPDVRRVLRLGKTERRRMGDEDVELASLVHASQPEAELELQRAAAHLPLRVLVGSVLVAQAAAEAGDTEAELIRDMSVDVDAALRTAYRRLPTVGGPCQVDRLKACVVVARDIEERNVEPADQVLEVIERQVATTEYEVGLDGRQPIAIQAIVDFVRDGEDARRRARPS